MCFARTCRGFAPPLPPRDKGGHEGSPGPHRSVGRRRCAGEVALFADTFNTYFEPENLRDAVEVLGRLGYRVAVAAGRSDGEAAAVLRAHVPVGRPGRGGARRGPPGPGRGRAVPGTRRSHRRAGALLPADPARRVLVHVAGRGHGASGLAGPALRGVPGPRGGRRAHRRADRQAPRQGPAARPLPPEGVRRHGRGQRRRWRWSRGSRSKPWSSSCCGMAGAFGYGADTHAASLAMGELSLLPAVRRAAAGRDHRRRRLLLPPPDPRRHRPRAPARRAHPAPGHGRRAAAAPLRPRNHAERGCDQWRTPRPVDAAVRRAGRLRAPIGNNHKPPATASAGRCGRDSGREAMSDDARAVGRRSTGHSQVAARLRRRTVPHRALAISATSAASACPSGSSPASAPD